jgi:hypothetical protein
MDDLYGHMKAALHTFGLQFGEKDKVAVSIDAEGISFTHDGLRITVLKDWK